MITPNAANYPAWIPVTEALPDMNSIVLVCYDTASEGCDTRVDVLCYIGSNFENLGWDHNQNVTAWMPLPEEIPAPAWIPVADALPELYSTVMVCFDSDPDDFGTKVDIMYYMGDNFENIGWAHDQNVIAWMPLPEEYSIGKSRP